MARAILFFYFLNILHACVIAVDGAIGNCSLRPQTFLTCIRVIAIFHSLNPNADYASSFVSLAAKTGTALQVLHTPGRAVFHAAARQPG